MHFHSEIMHVGVRSSSLLFFTVLYLFLYGLSSFLPLHPNCPTVSLNAIAGKCLFSLLLRSLDPSLHLALHWQVCSQCDARFCCAMLCDAKSPAGGQQPSFMLRYSDRDPLSIFYFLFLFLSLSLYPFLHFSAISKSPIWMPLTAFLSSLSFKLISVARPPLDCINSTLL